MKQKVEMKICMNCEKSRKKAMKIAVSMSGVESVAIQGNEKDRILVTGDGIDVFVLTKTIRKRVGFTELIRVAAVEKKK